MMALKEKFYILESDIAYLKLSYNYMKFFPFFIE